MQRLKFSLFLDTLLSEVSNLFCLVMHHLSFANCGTRSKEVAELQWKSFQSLMPVSKETVSKALRVSWGAVCS